MNASSEPGRVDAGLLFSFRNPARWRRPFPDVYADELALIRRAEELGFDTIWLTEHHFADDGYSPSVLTLAAAVAAVTERVRIGFNLLLLPLHNAIRVAEDVATLDVLSGGRIDVGVGQGYAVHEFAGFGVDRAERLSRFVEGLDVLEGLWTQDPFSYSGRHYRVDGARLSPKPEQAPMPLWIGANVESAVRRAGRRGANLLGLDSKRLQAAYEDARTSAGYPVDTAKVLQLHWTYVGADDDAAWAEAAPHFHHMMEVYAGWANASGDADKGGPRTVVPPENELRDPGRPLMFRPVFGGPDHVTTTLQSAIDRVRTTHLCLGVLPGMDPAQTEASLTRLARDVLPRLSRHG
jgi:alkanesulfonate monooxygenase SsuD/methylene tetrahydromethanopterin reductase-like flavin-dependent oxidoreductase (luciferase family)